MPTGSGITRTPEARSCHATHRSTRDTAKSAGMSQSAAGRIRRVFGLEPHVHEAFELSTDPFFVVKVRDGVALDRSPPEKTNVPSVDEKSRVQAPDRTRPIPPMTPGRVERSNRDSGRHRVTSLSAAFVIATGEVIGECHHRHRHREFAEFFDRVDATPTKEPGGGIHLILDNSATP